ncbi:MAG: hypothetical protein Q9M94_03875 [Candidatus Gracilibacteria bacterium]|nr:hypothetical protein [Candidatus Gracilibacteria bacterium]
MQGLFLSFSLLIASFLSFYEGNGNAKSSISDFLLIILASLSADFIESQKIIVSHKSHFSQALSNKSSTNSSSSLKLDIISINNFSAFFISSFFLKNL